MRVAFLGLGNMGQGMAARLLTRRYGTRGIVNRES